VLRREGTPLTIEKLAKLLAAVRERYPQHFAYVTTRASTVMRGCHVAGLQWRDIDEEAGVIRVVRKAVEGVVGEASRKPSAEGIPP
jgi:integrase